jgi:hypothetical protein
LSGPRRGNRHSPGTGAVTREARTGIKSINGFINRAYARPPPADAGGGTGLSGAPLRSGLLGPARWPVLRWLASQPLQSLAQKTSQGPHPFTPVPGQLRGSAFDLPNRHMLNLAPGAKFAFLALPAYRAKKMRPSASGARSACKANESSTPFPSTCRSPGSSPRPRQNTKEAVTAVKNHPAPRRMLVMKRHHHLKALHLSNYPRFPFSYLLLYKKLQISQNQKKDFSDSLVGSKNIPPWGCPVFGNEKGGWAQPGRRKEFFFQH